jgi:hypothetical protein
MGLQIVSRTTGVRPLAPVPIVPGGGASPPAAGRSPLIAAIIVYGRGAQRHVPIALAPVDHDVAERFGRFRYYLDRWGYLYRRAWVGGRRRDIYLHREILGLLPGDGVVVDHVNGDTLDNRRENLRETDHRGNAQNRHAVRGRSSYRGVSPYQGRWRASTTAQTGQRVITLHATELEAAQAAAARRAVDQPGSPEARGAARPIAP